jgi:hypothetical protein
LDGVPRFWKFSAHSAYRCETGVIVICASRADAEALAAVGEIVVVAARSIPCGFVKWRANLADGNPAGGYFL